MNIRVLLLTLICCPLGLFAIKTAVDTGTMSADELAAMHASFANSANFDEVLRTLQRGKGQNNDLGKVRKADLAMLKQKFEVVPGKENMTADTREYYLNRLRSQLVDLERRGVVAPQLEKEIGHILDDDQTPSAMSAFFDQNGSNIGVGVYHGLDGAFNLSQANKFSRGLKGTTPSDVWGGVNNNTNALGHVLAGVRNTAQGVYGLMPFLDKIPLLDTDDGENEASKHSLTSKVLGATHLATRGANLAAHLMTSDNHRLTAEQARLLSYYNRRHGVPNDIRNMHRARKRLNKARFGLRVLGQGVLPAMFAFGYNPNKDGDSYTSPGLAIANSSGIADALLGLYDRYRTNKMMKRIKNILPEVARELEEKPATQAELRDDQEAAANVMEAPDLPALM